MYAEYNLVHSRAKKNLLFFSEHELVRTNSFTVHQLNTIQYDLFGEHEIISVTIYFLVPLLLSDTET